MPFLKNIIICVKSVEGIGCVKKKKCKYVWIIRLYSIWRIMYVVYYRLFKKRLLETFWVHKDSREIFELKNDQPV